MPSSAVRRFTDPDEFAASVRGTAARYTSLASGSFTAKLARVDLHDLWLQRFDEHVARVAETANVQGRAIIEFGTGDAAAPVEAGMDLGTDSIYRFAEAQVSFQHTAVPTSIAVMSLPIDRLAAVGAVLTGAELRPPRDGRAVRPPQPALARLRQLHAAAAGLADDLPDIIASASAALALEQDLIQAMIACFAEVETRGDSSASRHHSRIIRRFHELVEESSGQPLHILELCTQLKVSDRTLRACCQEHLGMSPHRYLWMLQMTNARRALLRAEPGSATVTDIATAAGFWELGRFAVGYKKVFGESPSASLRRPPGGW